jgi:RHS repeat-associated protein
MSDLDRYQYGYDQNSNRLWKANVVGTAAVGNLDEGYAYDNLNRLTQMQRGTLSGGIITGTPAREMDYTLDPTGNWAAYLTKTSGTTDLNQTRSHSPVNEIMAIGGTPGWASPPTYDAAGNMNSFPQLASPSNALTALYDAWNRMVSVSDGSGTVATYQYDGRNRRIVKVTTAISETRHFYWTNIWRDIEERVGTSTSMDKQCVWGVRYVDELICRDDATPQRLYACQDANFNLTAITDISGDVVERYVFDPYGNRLIYDGSWTAQSTSSYSWVIGFQGLSQDPEDGLICVRNRYLHTMLGAWISRDPISATNNTSFYLYHTEGIDRNVAEQVSPDSGYTATPFNDENADSLGGIWRGNLYLFELANPAINRDAAGLQPEGGIAPIVNGTTRSTTGATTGPSTQPCCPKFCIKGIGVRVRCHGNILLTGAIEKKIRQLVGAFYNAHSCKNLPANCHKWLEITSDITITDFRAWPKILLVTCDILLIFTVDLVH